MIEDRAGRHRLPRANVVAWVRAVPRVRAVPQVKALARAKAFARRWGGEALRAGYDKGTRLAAIGPDSRVGSRFGAFGAGSIITFPHGALHGESYIHLGSDTLISPHVTLTAGILPGQTMATDPVIRIGDGCLIGRGTAIVGHLGIDVGDHVFIGMNVYITDQNHSYECLDLPIGHQIPSDETVRIGAGSWIGSGAVILPGAEIGAHVVVAANAVVRGHVPDRCVVAGVPARIVRRHHEGGGWLSTSPPAASEQPSLSTSQGVSSVGSSTPGRSPSPGKSSPKL